MSKSRSKRRRPSISRSSPPSQVQGPAELTLLPVPDPDPGPGPDDPVGVGNEAGQVQMLVGLIATGFLDDHLGTLQAAISRRHHDRQRTASNQAAAHLEIGDRVVLNHDIRPLYLHGATGTVTGWASHNVVVQLDNPTGRFTTGQVRCPPLGLRRLPG